jgi:hypothetical protein
MERCNKRGSCLTVRQTETDSEREREREREREDREAVD